MSSVFYFFTRIIIFLSISGTLISSSKKGIGPEGEDACPANTKSCGEYSPTPSPADTATPTASANEVAVKINGSNFFELLYGSISGAVQVVYKTAKHTGDKLYSTLQNTTGDYFEGFRQVLREEFYDLVINSYYKVVTTATAPGTTLHSLGISALTISLIVVCAIISYILLYFFSIFVVLTFNCVIVLLHHSFGPQWVFYLFYNFSSHVSTLLYFLLRHPYMFCALVVFLFLLSLVQPILRWTSRRSEKFFMRTLADSIVDLNQKIQNINEKLENMSTKIDDILGTVRKDL